MATPRRVHNARKICKHAVGLTQKLEVAIWQTQQFYNGKLHNVLIFINPWSPMLKIMLWHQQKQQHLLQIR